jgi:hypothetical protein
MPKVRTVTIDALRPEILAEVEGEAAAFERWDFALSLLALVEAPSATSSATDVEVDSFLQNVAAYYDPATKRVTIIDHGVATDPRDDLFVLSHEFVHSLQDQDLGLKGFRAKWVKSTDSKIANDVLLEGEATVIGALVLGQALGAPPENLNWSALTDGLYTSVFDSIDQSASPLLVAQQMAYPVGTDYLSAAWVDNGQTAIDALYEHPYRALLDWTVQYARAPHPTMAEPLDCYPTGAPPGFVADDHDTFGMAGALALLVATGDTASNAWSASSDWRNDSVVAFRPDTDPADPTRSALAWRVRWATAQAAQSFEASVRAVFPVDSVSTAIMDREVLVYAATDATTLGAWTEATRCGTAEELPTSATAGSMTQAMHRLNASLRVTARTR